MDYASKSTSQFMMYVCNVLLIISDENPCKIISNKFFYIEDNRKEESLTLSPIKQSSDKNINLGRAFPGC